MTAKNRIFRGAAATLLLCLGLTACSSDSTSVKDIAADTCDLLESVDMEELIGDAFEAAFNEKDTSPVGTLAKFERETEKLDKVAKKEGISEDEITEAMQKKCPDTLAEWEEFGDDFTVDASDASDDEDADLSADESSADPADLPDTPQAYSNLLVVGDETLLPEGTDGEVSLAAVGTSDGEQSSFAVLIQNRTDVPVSAIQISGRARTAKGDTIGSGASQGIKPNVIEPGGFAIGYVYIDHDEIYLPKGATLEDVSIDHTDGLGEYENIISLDVENFEQLKGGSFSGDVLNPHEAAISGPISVEALCLESKRSATHFSSFADRDALDAGNRSTFTIDTYGENLTCDVVLVGASGYED